MFAQIAADALGVELEDVTVESRRHGAVSARHLHDRQPHRGARPARRSDAAPARCASKAITFAAAQAGGRRSRISNSKTARVRVEGRTGHERHAGRDRPTRSPALRHGAAERTWSPDLAATAYFESSGPDVRLRRKRLRGRGRSRDRRGAASSATSWLTIAAS